MMIYRERLKLYAQYAFQCHRKNGDAALLNTVTMTTVIREATVARCLSVRRLQRYVIEGCVDRIKTEMLGLSVNVSF